MKAGILGINHKLANLKLRELLANTCQRRFGAGNSAHGDGHHFVLLSTCNRTEIYFSSENLSDTHTYLLQVLRGEVDEEFDQKLYSYFGRDCFHHLCRVATGLDSAIVGETEIIGQVKVAYEYAMQYISLPEPIHYLFQKALKVAKQIRTNLPVQRGLPDLEHAVLNAGMQTFPHFKQTRVLFVGASDINRKVLSFLKDKGITDINLCNRSENVACEMATTYGINKLSWQSLESWHEFDWIICGTKASKFLITAPESVKFENTKLLIDLSVPRNIDPNIKNIPSMHLYNIDELNQSLSIRHQQMADILQKAEHLVQELTSQQLYQKQQADTRRRIYINENFCSLIGNASFG